MVYQEVVIKDSRIATVKRRHPWIFSGGVYSHSDCRDGDLVEVKSKNGEYLATGYFQNGSIMVRILSFSQVNIDLNFWNDRLRQALELRREIGLPSDKTDVYRLVHGEGDGLPGLIIDVYRKIVVIQCHTIGMHMMRTQIAESLKNIFNNEVDTIYVKSGNTLPDIYAANHPDEYLLGECKETEVKENGCRFYVDIVVGQKTGFFIDQRENRALLRSMAKDKKILNLYSYTGGFSIYALLGNAMSVTSVDVSKTAIPICDRNVEMTGLGSRHGSIRTDVNNYLKEIQDDYYDIIVVDPPAFAKSARKSHNAVQAYKRVNLATMNKVKSGGLIFTFSCSQVIDMVLFYNTITAAAIEAGRNCQVLYRLSQGPDHPVSIFHPEGKYLKGLVLKIE